MTIYLLRASGTDMYKIGFTEKSPESRVQALQTGCPFPISIEAYSDGTRDDEARLHGHFATQRVAGEWFRMTPAQIETLRSVGLYRFVRNIEREDDGHAARQEYEEIERLASRFTSAFGAQHVEDELLVSSEAIKLFCDTAVSLAFCLRLNGNSNQCRHCYEYVYLGGIPERGDDDDDERLLAVAESEKEALEALRGRAGLGGHKLGCPIPFLQCVIDGSLP